MSNRPSGAMATIGEFTLNLFLATLIVAFLWLVFGGLFSLI